jgi:hypothetical protein
MSELIRLDKQKPAEEGVVDRAAYFLYLRLKS